LKPTSYSVAAEAKLAMWPPRSPGLRLARTTMAIAFQRISERMLPFDGRIAGALGLVLRGDGVDVFGGGRERQVGAGTAGQPDHAFEQLMRALGAFGVDHAFSDSFHSRVSAGFGSLSRTSFNQFISLPGPPFGAIVYKKPRV
jgi:hypothetical protein